MFVDAPPTGAPAGKFVSCEPSPKYVTIPDPEGPTVPPVPILIPLLAVNIPIESTFVTSSYVNVPAIPTVPLNTASVTKVISPVARST